MPTTRPKLSIFYSTIIGAVDRIIPQILKPLWTHPFGPRTVFFWAPFFKWGIVLAGLDDILNRHPNNISINQCAIMATTGLIWSRWSMVIKQKNYNLFAVNIFVFLTQGYLVCRALKWKIDNYSDIDDDYDYPNTLLGIPWVEYLG